MNRLTEKQHEIDDLFNEIFGLGKERPDKNIHWEKIREVLNLTNEVVAFGCTSDPNGKATKGCLQLVGESDKDFFQKHKQLSNYQQVWVHPGWEKDDFKRLYALEMGDFDGALRIARKIIQRMTKGRKKISQVCGPINHGTLGKKVNIEKLFRTILKLSRVFPVFDQIPFVPVFDRWEKEFEWDPKETVIVDSFFKKIAEEELTNNTFFIEGFNDSLGACREHDIFMEFPSILIFHLEAGYEKSSSFSDGLFRINKMEFERQV